MRRARWKRKNVSRWGSVPDSRQIPARAVVQAGVWRFQTPASSRSAAAPWALRGSASGKRRRGCPEDPNPRTTHTAGRDLPDFYRTLPPRSALFFWTVHGPFSFRQERKENGGCIPRAEAARPLIGNQENVTTVPVFPSRASRHRSRLVMIARRPGLARTNFIAAWTLGSILPTPNWPSAAYRAASARLR